MIMEDNNLGGFFYVCNRQVDLKDLFNPNDGDHWSSLPSGFQSFCVRENFRSPHGDPSFPSAGSSRRYQVNAVHTSKACNVISKYTAYVPVDVSLKQYLPTVVAYPSSGKADGQPGSHPPPMGWRKRLELQGGVQGRA